ncbi:unnamed protein product [Amoebophrya sp. A120]|nr:unnamed protein product [Amoebophrya sp. A120]|eukprot:GSA120T00019389001.1
MKASSSAASPSTAPATSKPTIHRTRTGARGSHSRVCVVTGSPIAKENGRDLSSRKIKANSLSGDDGLQDDIEAATSQTTLNTEIVPAAYILNGKPRKKKNENRFGLDFEESEAALKNSRERANDWKSENEDQGELDRNEQSSDAGTLSSTRASSTTNDRHTANWRGAAVWIKKVFPPSKGKVTLQQQDFLRSLLGDVDQQEKGGEVVLGGATGSTANVGNRKSVSYDEDAPTVVSGFQNLVQVSESSEQDIHDPQQDQMSLQIPTPLTSETERLMSEPDEAQHPVALAPPEPLSPVKSATHYYLSETDRRSREKIEHVFRSSFGGGRNNSIYTSEDPALVCPYLYIGSMAICTSSILKRHKIDYLVNACATVTSMSSCNSNCSTGGAGGPGASSSPPAATPSHQASSSTIAGPLRPTFSLALADHPKYALNRDTMDDLVQFIDDARARKKTVLIFCARGVSRCATVCCWYLLCARLATSVNGALALVQKNRPICDPNKGFRKQLKDLELEIREFTAIGDEFLKIDSWERKKMVVDQLVGS